MICIEGSRFFLAPLLFLQIYYHNLYIQIQKSAWAIPLTLIQADCFLNLGWGYPAAEQGYQNTSGSQPTKICLRTQRYNVACKTKIGSVEIARPAEERGVYTFSRSWSFSQGNGMQKNRIFYSSNTSGICLTILASTR